MNNGSHVRRSLEDGWIEALLLVCDVTLGFHPKLAERRKGTGMVRSELRGTLDGSDPSLFYGQ
jgi:hypothetical protein